MDKMKELEEFYRQYTNKNFSFLSDNGILLTEITSLMLLFDNVYYDVEETIKYFFVSYLQRPELMSDLSSPMQEFFNFYKQICFNANFREFMNLAAQIYLDNYREVPEYATQEKPVLPKCDKDGVAFVDLISGFNFSHFFPTLNESTQYYLVDKSIMTCELLELQKQKFQVNNVHILCKDIDDFEKNDIKQDIGIVRIKNAFRYVPDFKDKIEKFKSYICSDGRFIFQEQSIAKTILHPVYKDIDSYFIGWNKEIQHFETQNPNSLDSIEFKRA